MLTLLFLLSVLGGHSSSVPLLTRPDPIPDPFTFRIFGREVSAPDCLSGSRQRSAQDILWSCIAVIFACTWVAVHPNIPSPKESGLSRVWRRVGIMFYALLAPEVMTTWALRQRRAARRIAREYNETYCQKDYERVLKLTRWDKLVNCVKHWVLGPDENAPKVWTLSHGFFVQMGGFLLIGVDGGPERVLTFSDMMEKIRGGEIKPPTFSDAAIRDKSKSDLLIKLIVVLQTCWFVAQCGARWVQRLTVTELEVITLAFAILNIATYALWWNKPQDVQVALPIKRVVKGNIIRSESPDMMDGKPGDETESPRVSGLHTTHVDTGAVQEFRPTPVTRKSSWLTLASRSLLGIDGSGAKFPDLVCILRFLTASPGLLVVGFLRPLWKTNPCIPPEVTPTLLRVPMFYADKKGEGLVDNLLPFIANGVIVVFGALHLVLWVSSFPTDEERSLWRICALLITILPGVSTFTILLNLDPAPTCAPLREKRRANRTAIALTVYLLIVTFVYILSRLVLIILALMSVRDLPPDAYENVQWSDFLPHI